MFKLTPQLITALSFILLSACAQGPSKESSKLSASAPSPSTSPQALSVSQSDRDAYKKALIALNDQNLDKAQRLFNQFTRDKPELAGGYANLALIHFKRKEFDKALKQVNKALERNPEQAPALNIRAQLYIKNGKIHKAKEDYLKAIKTDPKYANAQYNLALLYDIYLQEIALAIKHYKIYLSLLKEPDKATEEWVTHLEGTLKNG